MKKNILFCIALLLCCVQAGAQKTLNIYQDGLIIKKIPAAQVDSISLTDREPYTINMWSGGRIFQTYASEEVDSIKVIDEKGGPLSYLGVVGFNSELYKKDVSLLATSTISQHESFIDNLSKKDGTILYYAVDNALDLLEKSNIKTQLSNINVVTFTDGLDQGSIMMNQNYASSNAYLQAISNRINNSKFKGLKVDAYTIGLRGNDVSDVDMFHQNLNSLASSNQNAFELKNMSQLDTRLQEIANKIISVNTRQTISVKIPGVDNGTRVRFTFDGRDAEYSQLYIDGTINLSDYSLRDITYYGMKARSGSYVQGTQEGVFITFTFRGLHKEYGDEVLPTNNVKQYYRLPSSYSWQINSEFRPTNNTQRIVAHSGTAIILVLDCSSSLGSDFTKMKNYAKKFIRQVANNALPFTFGSPQNVQAAMDNNAFAINVSWDAVKGADYYQVYRSSKYSSGYTLVADNVTSCSWKDTSLQGSSFYYKVCAVGLGMTSGMSNYTSQVQCSLAAPQNVKGELTKSNSKLAVNVKWDPVKYAEYYQVYRASSSYSSYNYSLIADNVTSTSYLDLSPLSGNNYYKIRAVGHGMTSSDSYASDLISNLMPTPTNVVGELVLNGSNLAINVTWDAVALAEKYQVYRSNSSYYGFELLADNVTSNSWKDTAPLSGNNYYKIYAVGYGLTSNESYVSNSVNCTLNAPQNVTATLDNTEFAVTVSWNAVEYATHYKVYRSKDDYSYELVADNITSCSWKDISPEGNANYYKVYAVCNGFTGSASSYAYVYCSLDAPQNVKGELTTSNSKLAVNVKWDPVKYAEYYQVYRSSSNYSSSYYYSLIADNVTSTSYVDLSPLSGSNYYRIRAVGHGMTSSDSNTSGQISNQMSVPTNVVASLDNTNYVVNVSWDLVNFASYYKVYRSSSSYGSFEMVADNVTANSWKDTTPLSGNNYYKIYAVGYGLTSNESRVSNSVNCTLNAPQNVKATLDDTEFAVTVSWSAIVNATHYKVYRSKDGYTYELVADNIKSCNWKDVSPEGSYNYYKVYAVCNGFTGSASSYAYVYCSLDAPQNVKGELTVSNSKVAVNVKWDQVKYAEYYQVYRASSSYSSYNYSLIADNVTSTSYLDLSPLSGNNYYKIRAVGHGMTSSDSNTSGNVNTTSISAPSNVKGALVLDGNNLAINVTWDAVAVAEKYQVYRSSSSYGSFEMAADNVASNSWKDTAPLVGSNYYKVVAIGYGLTSQQSNVSSMVNCALDAPQNVGGQLVINGDKIAVSVTWDAVLYAENYTIYRCSSYSGTYSVVAENVSTNSWKDETPLEGSNYYKVVAVGYSMTSSQSSYSNVVNLTLNTPQNLRCQLVLSNNQKVVSLSWDAVEFANSYSVYRSNSIYGDYVKIADGVTSTTWNDESPLEGYNYYKVVASGYGLTSSMSSYTYINKN